MKILMILIYSTVMGVELDHIQLDSMKECYTIAGNIYKDYAENSEHRGKPMQGILCTKED